MAEKAASLYQFHWRQEYWARWYLDSGWADCVHSDELESFSSLAGQQFGWESAHTMQRVGKTAVQLICGFTM